MALPAHILVHLGTPVSYEEDAGAPWIEGEPGTAGVRAVDGVAFPCVLFLPGPGGSADTPYRPRVVRQPTLLLNPIYDDGITPVVLTSEMELLVAAPELAPWTGASTARWLVAGDAQPFGPPGTVLGIQAILRQVKD